MAEPAAAPVAGHNHNAPKQNQQDHDMTKAGFLIFMVALFALIMVNGAAYIWIYNPCFFSSAFGCCKPVVSPLLPSASRNESAAHICAKAMGSRHGSLSVHYSDLATQDSEFLGSYNVSRVYRASQIVACETHVFKALRDSVGVTPDTLAGNAWNYLYQMKEESLDASDLEWDSERMYKKLTIAVFNSTLYYSHMVNKGARPDTAMGQLCWSPWIV